MSSYSLSLDKTYERKIELLRKKNKRYQNLVTIDILNLIVRDTLDKEVPNLDV